MRLIVLFDKTSRLQPTGETEMAAITHNSLRDLIPTFSMPSFAAEDVADTPGDVAEATQERSQEAGDKWAQLAVIVSGIAGACFLASTGVLPAFVLTSCAVAMVSVSVKLAIVVVAAKVFGIEVKEDSEYGVSLKKASPISTCVIIPIIEEVFFRIILQGSLYAAFSYILPPVTVVVLGFSLPAAALASIVTAGVIFGVMHASNHPDNPKVGVLQAGLASMSGIFVEGMLYHTFGFGASCLAHIVNNTIVTCVTQASETFCSEEEEPPVPAPLPV